MNVLPAAGLLVLGLLPVLGRFLPPTLAWGFHHAAYLPAWMTAVLLFGWLLLFVRPFRRTIEHALYDRLAPGLFGRSIVPAFLCAAGATVLFVLARTPTHFLGDGVLVGELAGLGSRFRAHDLMDYQLHRLLVKAMGIVGDTAASFRLYAWGSWIAGLLAVLIALLLLRRSRLPATTKLFAFILWLVAAPSLLYCGYVESYGYLSVAMLGFLYSGALAQRGECPPWIPGVFYGLALFFHTTAVFAGPALLWLAWRPGPARAAKGRWRMELLAPAILLPLIAIGIHLALGYDATWFRRDFIESKNQRHLFVRLTGDHGLLTPVSIKDLANWLLLVVPVTGWLLITKAKAIRARLREPDFSFLLVQSGCFALAFLLIDRKLGAARDWDLLTPQVAGFSWMAARLWETDVREGGGTGELPSVRIAAPWAALLLVVPWFFVNASREASLTRFDEMRGDFPRFARGYAAEELAKYHRDNSDMDRALRYYRESVGISPRNARTRVLLGSVYYMQERIPEAQAQYDTALTIDPKMWMALDMKAKIAVKQNDFASALSLYRRLAPLRGDDPDVWAGYGYTALRQQEYPESRAAFVRALQLRFDPKVLHFAGLACAYAGSWDEAVELLRRSTQTVGEDPTTLAITAAVLEARYAEKLARGESPPRSDLEAARDCVARAVKAAPKEAQLAQQLRHLDRVLAGEEKPVNNLKP